MQEDQRFLFKTTQEERRDWQPKKGLSSRTSIIITTADHFSRRHAELLTGHDSPKREQVKRQEQEGGEEGPLVRLVPCITSTARSVRQTQVRVARVDPTTQNNFGWRSTLSLLVLQLLSLLPRVETQVSFSSPSSYTSRYAHFFAKQFSSQVSSLSFLWHDDGQPVLETWRTAHYCKYSSRFFFSILYNIYFDLGCQEESSRSACHDMFKHRSRHSWSRKTNAWLWKE